ncbi:hypothetical protein F4778DRAFT_726340 [Xylariomycetidae sp. FL2044]|nr:hypothetical protein F4778DRAFT_726340 [Xylariomycetidae sp. FL2044]
MAESREERMQQRMRGAGRHEVADDSFGFVLPAADASPDMPPPAPALRSEPNTSAKRRKLNTEPLSAVPQPPSSGTRSSARLSASRPDPYDVLADKPPENEVSQHPTSTPTTAQPQQDDGDTLESLPATVPRPPSRSSVASLLISPGRVGEEVTESPAGAPGSGHRRRIRISSALAQSANLQRAVMEEEAGATVELTTSSPLARKTRKSVVTPSALSTRSTRANMRGSQSSAIEPIDELSPAPRRSRRSDSTAASGSARSLRSQGRRSTPSTVIGELSSPPEAAGTSSARKPQPKPKANSEVEPPEPQPKDREDVENGDAAEEEEEAGEAPAADEGAEEIDAHEAARKIGRKRPRVSLQRDESPELHSRVDDFLRPTEKKRQRRTQASPAKQAQPKPKQPKSKSRLSVRRRSDGETIPITVQRYTKPVHRNEDDTDADILAADIPFANRSGVNVVDVLSQMCDEVIEWSLEKVHDAAVHAENTGIRKELRTKLRALEAFQAELRTRLLEHTIALDTMHALKKRVRSVQKEKLALRSEILRIRAEREQVALRMDAVRVRHETTNKESLHQLGLSSAMDDIELAVENGKSAPDLVDPKAHKAAELANLELLISRVASQATSAGDGGGNLKQIKDFNAFLERAAVALESR